MDFLIIFILLYFITLLIPLRLALYALLVRGIEDLPWLPRTITATRARSSGARARIRGGLAFLLLFAFFVLHGSSHQTMQHVAFKTGKLLFCSEFKLTHLHATLLAQLEEFVHVDYLLVAYAYNCQRAGYSFPRDLQSIKVKFHICTNIWPIGDC